MFRAKERKKQHSISTSFTAGMWNVNSVMIDRLGGELSGGELSGGELSGGELSGGSVTEGTHLGIVAWCKEG